MSEHIIKSVASATKWSAITEVMAKLVTPITTMVLARLLTPEAYGVVATVTMIITFTEIFSEAGFHRYIIQHEFEDDDDLHRTTDVAFVTNFIFAIILWVLIIAIRNPLASWVGNPGLGNVIAIACISIPIQALCVIQKSLFQRNFDFKTLFFARLVGIIIPLAVTIPLAYVLRNFWALIVGTILTNLSNAIILTWRSKWKPSLRYYDFKRLKEMLSFSSWIIVDEVLVWATGYIDVFMIGISLSPHYLGIYKTSMSLVGQITALITAIVLPVMFPALSRLQNDHNEMRNMIFKFQKMTGLILIPIGVGIFVFRDFFVNIFLGKQWSEAAGFVGLWGLMNAITIIYSRFCSNIYPAIGKPYYSVIAQILHLVFLVPAVVISVRYGYETLYITRSLIRFQLILVNICLAYYLIKLSPWQMFLNTLPEFGAAMVMAVCGYLLLQVSDSILWASVSIGICVIVYFALLMPIKNERKIIMKILRGAITKISK